jgi:hypothetical protein
LPEESEPIGSGLVRDSVRKIELAGIQENCEQRTTEEVLAEHDLELGMSVGVDEEPDLYRIAGVGRDGSLTVVGDTERQFRSFLPVWCYPATRVGRAASVSLGDSQRSGVACARSGGESRLRRSRRGKW